MAIRDWNTTASDNDDADDDIDLNGAAASIRTADNSMRAIMQKVAISLADTNGSRATTGSSGTYAYASAGSTATPADGFSAYADGDVLIIEANHANTGAATLNVDSVGAKAIRLQGDTALTGGEIVANGKYLFIYDSSFNSSAGAWVLFNRSVLSGIDGHDANETRGADVASASTINLDTATGSFVDVTGTTTITSITLSDGRQRIIRAAGALPITASGTFIVDGETSGTTTYAANDLLLVVGFAAFVTVTHIGPVDPSSTGGWTLLGSASTTSGTVADLSVTVTGYQRLAIRVKGISASDPSTMSLLIQSGGGFTGSDNISPSMLSAQTLQGIVYIDNPANSGVQKPITSLTRAGSTIFSATTVAGETGVISDLRISTSAGTFDAGSYDVYGIK